MILPFSTQFKDGTPTNFIEKIWNGLILSDECDEHLGWLFDKGHQTSKIAKIPNEELHPKITTIREDAHDRWHAGRLIHPVVFNRSKNQFQFAPTMPCKSVQYIQIKANPIYEVSESVFIDGRMLSFQEVEILAKNDGFESITQFFEWFNKDFIGKIIHWTDLKY